MKLRSRIFVESEVFGREYFEADADFQRLWANARNQTQQDGITRRVGWEFEDAEEYLDEKGESDATNLQA